MTWGRWLYLTSEGRRAADLYRHYKSIASVRFKHANLGSNGKHANHYISVSTYFNNLKHV
jgi:hypothetical protein